MKKLKNKLSINKLVVFLMMSFLLPACQLLVQQETKNIMVTNTINYNQYYLGLKNLSEADLLVEIKQQNLKKSQGSIEAEINLLLLYSLPNSPVHNAFSAKSQLNEQLKTHKNYQFSPADRAFMTVLKDQLNQQLYLFQQVINQDLEHDKQMEKNKVEQLIQQDLMTELNLKVSQLTEQITQLKKIEKTINSHGQ